MSENITLGQRLAFPPALNTRFSEAQVREYIEVCALGIQFWNVAEAETYTFVKFDFVVTDLESRPPTTLD